MLRAERSDLGADGRGIAFVRTLRAIWVPVIVCGIVVPCLLAFFGGSIARLAYPAYALLTGLVFFGSRKAAYPGFCIALFAFSPFARRVVDYGAGFADFNPVLLAPYLALLPCLGSLMRQAMTRRPQSLAFLLLIVCVLYGAFLALVQDRVIPAIYEGLRWILPIALAAFIVENRAISGGIRASLAVSLAVILPIISAYGVAQYFNPQPWDVMWLQNVMESTGTNSFGRPEAYQIRVFSTLNSPGSLAMFLASAVPLMLGEGGLIALAGVAGLPALLLSIVRSGWLACIAGVAVTFLAARAARQMTFLAAGFGVVALGIAFAGSVQLAPEVVNSLTERFSTFSEIGSDGSAQERLDTYSSFFERLADSPLGEGFGANASLSSSADKRDLPPLDSGLLEAFLTFGPVVGALYFIAFGHLIWLGYAAARKARGSMPGHIGAVMSVVAVIPLGSNQLGESGIIMWVALGILIASADVRVSYPVPALR